MIIDGIEYPFAETRSRDGWTWFYIYNEKRQPVAEHSVPTWFLSQGGKIKTGGHVYELSLR